MVVCDICNAPGKGTIVSAEHIREAVFGNGFNPFKLGLVPDMGAMFGMGREMSYNHWKTTIVAQDTSDWNVCSKCLEKLRPYLKSPPKATGVTHARVSTNPIEAARLGAIAEERYQPPSPSPPPKNKVAGRDVRAPLNRLKVIILEEYIAKIEAARKGIGTITKDDLLNVSAKLYETGSPEEINAVIDEVMTEVRGGQIKTSSPAAMLPVLEQLQKVLMMQAMMGITRKDQEQGQQIIAECFHPMPEIQKQLANIFDREHYAGIQRIVKLFSSNPSFEINSIETLRNGLNMIMRHVYEIPLQDKEEYFQEVLTCQTPLQVCRIGKTKLIAIIFHDLPGFEEYFRRMLVEDDDYRLMNTLCRNFIREEEAVADICSFNRQLQQLYQQFQGLIAFETTEAKLLARLQEMLEGRKQPEPSDATVLETVLQGPVPPARYQICFRGEITAGQNKESVKKQIAKLFKIPAKQVERLFSGQPVVIKKDIDRPTAAKYQKAIEQAGAICSIEPFEPDVRKQAVAEPVPPVQQAPCETVTKRRILTQEERDAFWQAVKAGETLKVQFMLADGIDPDTRTDDGGTPLMTAAADNHILLVDLLIEQGADVNASDQNGITPLMAAAFQGHTDIVTSLLEKGADMNITNAKGQTALTFAENKGHIRIFEMLFDRGGDANTSNPGGATALMRCAQEGKLEFVRALLSHGANVNATLSDGRTAFSLAAQQGHLEIAKLLLAGGADVNVADQNGGTALMEAAASGNLAVVKMLLEHGVNINATYANGATALDFAKHHGRQEIVRLLEQASQASNTPPGTPQMVNQAIPPQALEWFNQGVESDNSGNTQEAIACYDRAIGLCPQYADALENKGVALWKLGRHPEAIACYDQALALNPQKAQTWSNKGAAYYLSGKGEEALQCFDQALFLDPDHLMAQENKGNALLEMGRVQEALGCYEKILERHSSVAAAWNHKGNALLALQRSQEALHCFQQAVALDPVFFIGWFNQGVVLYGQKQYGQAIVCYDKALHLQPQYLDALNNKGVALHESGKSMEALVCYETILAINPNYANAWAGKGNVFLHLNRNAEATECFEQAARLGHPQAIALLQQQTGMPAGENLRGEIWARFLLDPEFVPLGMRQNVNPIFTMAKQFAGMGMNDLNLQFGNQYPVVPFSRVTEKFGQYDRVSKSTDGQFDLYEWNGFVIWVESASQRLHGFGLTPELMKRLPQAADYFEAAKQYVSSTGGTPPQQGSARRQETAKQEEQKQQEQCRQEQVKREANIWNQKGLELQNANHHKEALASFDSALQIYPQFEQALANKGVSLMMLKQYKQALTCLDAALKLNRHPHTLLTKARIFFEQQQFKEALPCYNEILRFQAENMYKVMALVQSSMCLISQKDGREALRRLKEAFAIDPENQDLIWILENVGVPLGNSMMAKDPNISVAQFFSLVERAVGK